MMPWKSKEIENIYTYLCTNSLQDARIQKTGKYTFRIDHKNFALFLTYYGTNGWRLHLDDPLNEHIGSIPGKSHIAPTTVLSIFQQAFHPDQQSLLKKYQDALKGLATAFGPPITTITCNPHAFCRTLNFQTKTTLYASIKMTPKEHDKTSEVIQKTGTCSPFGRICIGTTLWVDRPNSNHERLHAYETAKTLMPRTLRKIEKIDKTLFF